uniref:Apolipoprotein L 8 n=1 Tax=Jaculus jaculus TaxID=51337 RepID=A0A8C5K577_JACJA
MSGNLQLLLAEDGAWEAFVAEAELSRAEADALREALAELTANMAEEDKDRLTSDLQDQEQFVVAFPQVRVELEEHIGKLRTLADKVDRLHRDCTISNVVADSTSAISGVLTLLGLALVPMTAGVSLVLLSTGMGLAAAAAITSISTSIVEHSNKLSVKTEASRLVTTSMDRMKVVAEAVVDSMPKLHSLSKNCIRVLQSIEKTIQAIKLSRANPALAARARQLLTIGRVSVQHGKQAKKAVGGTALAMSRGARIMGAATAGVTLLVDVVSLAKESKHLRKGAKAKLAGELRRQAQDLEGKLGELVRLHESL